MEKIASPVFETNINYTKASNSDSVSSAVTDCGDEKSSGRVGFRRDAHRISRDGF